jgi:pyridoxine 4-dehydrogenase
VLRTAVELGVNHIDTADAYGPYITNEISRRSSRTATTCTS